MKKTPDTTPDIDIQANPVNFSPTQTQIDALARRLIPEIKKFFADEQTQRDFVEWQQRQGLAKADK